MTDDSAAPSSASLEQYRELRTSKPELFWFFARQAKLAIEGAKRAIPPKKAARLLRRLISREVGPNRKIRVSTYDVKTCIDAMLTDPAERENVKAYYMKALRIATTMTTTTTSAKKNTTKKTSATVKEGALPNPTPRPLPSTPTAPPAPMAKSSQVPVPSSTPQTPGQHLTTTTEALKKAIEEAAYEEITNISKEQRDLCERAELYLDKVHFLKEYKHISTRKSLKEFFGPFKKLKTADLAQMADQGALKRVASKIKDTEAKRKALSTTTVMNVPAVESALESYVDSLVALFNDLKSAEVPDKVKEQTKKVFATAAFTIQSLQNALSKAAAGLFSKVPRSSGLFAGVENADVAARTKAFTRNPLQALGAAAKAVGQGPGPGPGAGRFSTSSLAEGKPKR